MRDLRPPLCRRWHELLHVFWNALQLSLVWEEKAEAVKHGLSVLESCETGFLKNLSRGYVELSWSPSRISKMQMKSSMSKRSRISQLTEIVSGLCFFCFSWKRLMRVCVCVCVWLDTWGMCNANRNSHKRKSFTEAQTLQLTVRF